MLRLNKIQTHFSCDIFIVSIFLGQLGPVVAHGCLCQLATFV